jgi:hypothetical protein
MERETINKVMDRMVKESIPSMKRKMASVIASANQLKTVQHSNNVVAHTKKTR